MPHGYKCDRCGAFVEQSRNDFRLAHPKIDGQPEEVYIANPAMQSDEGQGVEAYTLCDDCRMALIDNVGAFDA